jgi:hypothetical protein
MPGSGKSTTAHMLSLHMTRHGLPARWHYEHESPHPIFHYPDILAAIEEGCARDGLFENAIERWTDLARQVAVGSTSVVIESAFFQIPVHPMRLMDWDEPRIAAYANAVAHAIAPVAPLLVLLRHEDVEHALMEAVRWRGEWFGTFLEEKIGQSPYGRARDIQGFPGVVRYFTEYRDLVDRLLFALRIPLLILDASSGQKAASADAIAAAIGLPPIVPFSTSVRLDPFPGKYTAIGSDSVFDIVSDGEHLYVGGEMDTRLFHRGGTTFELCGTPVRLDFVPGNDGRMASIDCTGALPNLARQWVRSE